MQSDCYETHRYIIHVLVYSKLKTNVNDQGSMLLPCCALGINIIIRSLSLRNLNRWPDIIAAHQFWITGCLVVSMYSNAVPVL